MTVDRSDLERGSSEPVVLVSGILAKDSQESPAVQGFVGFDRVYVEVAVGNLKKTQRDGNVVVSVQQSSNGIGWSEVSGGALTFDADGVQRVSVTGPADYLKVAWAPTHLRSFRLLRATVTPGSLDSPAAGTVDIVVVDAHGYSRTNPEFVNLSGTLEDAEGGTKQRPPTLADVLIEDGDADHGEISNLDTLGFRGGKGIIRAGTQFGRLVIGALTGGGDPDGAYAQVYGRSHIGADEEKGSFEINVDSRGGAGAGLHVVKYDEDSGPTWTRILSFLATGVLKLAGDAGNEGDVLTSGGAGAPASWQPGGGGSQPLVNLAIPLSFDTPGLSDGVTIEGYTPADGDQLIGFLLDQTEAWDQSLTLNLGYIVDGAWDGASMISESMDEVNSSGSMGASGQVQTDVDAASQSQQVFRANTPLNLVVSADGNPGSGNLDASQGQATLLLQILPWAARTVCTTSPVT